MGTSETSVDGPLQQGRDAFERRAWRAAHQALSCARDTGDLSPDDLWRLAVSSYLIGGESDFIQALEDGHAAYLSEGDPMTAVRCAFWLGLHLGNAGEMARASGWFGRAARLLEGEEEDRPERGYVLIPSGYRHFVEGQHQAAAATAEEAAAIGRRFGDIDLHTLALHLQGRALLRLGKVEEGLALLDEAMVAVATDELSPMMAGLVYCSVIGACREVYAVRRVQEWTTSLRAWCDARPDMVAYTGECRCYHAEILTRSGLWREAIDEAQRAADAFARHGQRGGAGLAHYQRGEAHRLLGEHAAAEEAYRLASRHGYEPLPGLALLRLAQDDRPAAEAAMARALAEARDHLARARLVPAYIEIVLEEGQTAEARRLLGELVEAAEGCAPGVLDAVIAHARGAIELASGRPTEALGSLRAAWNGWQAIDAPYDAARARTLLGLACRALGDRDGAMLELSAAREELQRLGARDELTRLDATAPLDGSASRDAAASPDASAAHSASAADHGLTAREREVLAQIATGGTNRAIAKTLSISEKTVARHVANIFQKLGLSSRAAATAYAYQHGLADPST